jgi:hypothetical protein
MFSTGSFESRRLALVALPLSLLALALTAPLAGAASTTTTATGTYTAVTTDASPHCQDPPGVGQVPCLVGGSGQFTGTTGTSMPFIAGSRHQLTTAYDTSNACVPVSGTIDFQPGNATLVIAPGGFLEATLDPSQSFACKDTPLTTLTYHYVASISSPGVSGAFEFATGSLTMDGTTHFVPPPFYLPATDSASFQLSYTVPQRAARTINLSPLDDTGPVGSQHTVTALLQHGPGEPAPGIVARFSVSGANTASGSGTSDSSGRTTFTYTGANPGNDVITAYADNDEDQVKDPDEPASFAGQTWFATLPAGAFVIGDQNASVGSSVTFWGARLSFLNPLSGDDASPSFKGFAGQTAANSPACGGQWTSSTGNSAKPPATVPPLMAVIVTSSVGKSGSTIFGNTAQVVVVRTNPGYEPSPGHPGTGTVVAAVCGG